MPVFSTAILLGACAVLGNFGGAWPRTALSLLSLGWGWTAWKAWQAVRCGDIPRHHAWMLRHFALTLAAVSLRVQSALYCGLGADFPSIYGYLAWLSWVPNLLVAELMIRYPSRLRK